jgi:hypothetical protein
MRLWIYAKQGRITTRLAATIATFISIVAAVVEGIKVPGEKMMY